MLCPYTTKYIIEVEVRGIWTGLATRFGAEEYVLHQLRNEELDMINLCKSMGQFFNAVLFKTIVEGLKGEQQ